MESKGSCSEPDSSDEVCPESEGNNVKSKSSASHASPDGVESGDGATRSDPGETDDKAACHASSPDPQRSDNRVTHDESSDPRKTDSQKPSSDPQEGINSSMRDRYVASMVLSGVGDAMGYHGGKWEFNLSGKKIHEELEELGGLQNLNLSAERDSSKSWIVSDDTVMHIATAKALIKNGEDKPGDGLYEKLSNEYIQCMRDMKGRAAGPTSMHGVKDMEVRRSYKIPFNPKGGGCGAAMRAMCIGLRYPRKEELDDLIAVSIESGRMTHNHPTGYLGGLAAALFTQYAIEEKPVISWGKELMSVLQKAQEFIKRQGRDVTENLRAWSYFEDQWKNYLKHRGIEDGKSEPKFEENFDVEARDKFYKSVSFSNWGGASGHDAPMIAYDALLGSGDSWTELCLRGVLHGGDNDSTGAIAGAWFGALYGFKGVPKAHYEGLEKIEEIEKLGKDIYELAFKRSADADKCQSTML